MLVAGLAHDEIVGGDGLIYHLMDPLNFVIDPRPNLLSTRDSSVWTGDRVPVTNLAMRARQRETTLTHAIYRHHPRFAGTSLLYEPQLEHLEGGDVLLLAPGVIAVGVGERARSLLPRMRSMDASVPPTITKANSRTRRIAVARSPLGANRCSHPAPLRVAGPRLHRSVPATPQSVAGRPMGRAQSALDAKTEPVAETGLTHLVAGKPGRPTGYDRSHRAL